MKYTFLIVDAEKAFRDLLHFILEENYSCNIFEASNKKQAFSLLKDQSIDLIVMDLLHPNGGGIDLVKEIRLDPKLWYIPIIVLTTFRNKLENIVPYESVQGVIQKPIYATEVIHHVNLVLHENKNPDIALLKMGTETQTLDYKKDINLATKVGCVSLAKDVIAMANSGGGILIIGVAEKAPGEFELIGLKDQQLKLFETSLINKAIRRYISPLLATTSRRVNYRSKTFIFIEVPEGDCLVMAARQNEEANLYLGRIYGRTHAAESTELHASADVQKIIDRLILNQKKGRWQKIILQK